MALNLPAYSQFDPRWASMELVPGMTMGRWGCMVTSICMALKNYAIDITPGDLCAKLKAINGFDSEGNLKHEAVSKLYPDVIFYERVYTSNFPGQGQKWLVSAAIERVKNLLALGQPAILNVDNVGNDGIPDHWVMAKEYRNGDFLIHNPDGGLEQWFSQRYGDPTKKLFGHYAILGPAIGYPDSSSHERQQMGLALWKAAMVWKGRNVQTYSKEIVDALLN